MYSTSDGFESQQIVAADILAFALVFVHAGNLKLIDTGKTGQWLV